MIQFIADGLLLALIPAAAVILLFATNRQTKLRVYPYVIMAGLTSLLVGKLLSLVYQPATERPFIEQGLKAGAAYIDNPGFPSDHVLLATIIALTVAVLVRKKWLTITMAALVVLIGLGRILALVHNPVDVIGGIVAGLSGGVWYFFLTKNK